MKKRQLKEETIEISEYSNVLLKKIREFVDEFEELETMSILFLENNKKGFAVLTDNGAGGKMKKFNIIIEE